MKRNRINVSMQSLTSRLALLVGGSMLMLSCGAQMGGYSETDGVYYDPETDTIPEGMITGREGNQIDEYYDYNEDHAGPGIIEKSRANKMEKEYRRKVRKGATDSDWGTYAGTETNIYTDYWGWGSPFGYYSPYGYNRFGLSIGFGWGWGNSWYMSPYYAFGYNPWYYGGWYSPIYAGYHPWGWGPGYYDYWYGVPAYGYYSPNRYAQSGPVRGFVGSPVNGVLRQPARGSFRNTPSDGPANVERGFRTDNGNYRGNGGFRNGGSYPAATDPRTPRGGFRNPAPTYEPSAPRPNTRYQSAPVYESSGGFRGGSSSPSSGGGFRGGSSSSGGGSMRSGGFR